MIGAAAFSRGGTVPDEASADVIALAIDVIDEAYWTVRRAEQDARARCTWRFSLRDVRPCKRRPAS
jgi:hypothetical protein